MPSLPHRVAGQPGQPGHTVMTQPPPEAVIPEPTPEPVPEPGPTQTGPTTSLVQERTQEQLAEVNVQQQTIPQRRTMTPNSEPGVAPYTFTDEDRQKAIRERWGKRFDWEKADVQEALAFLAEIRAETEKGGIILQKRISEMKVEKVKCFGCDNIINLTEGRYATMRTRNNFETGLPESAYACSAACGLKLNRDFTHPVRIPQARQG